MSGDILRTIVARRRRRIESEGHAQGLDGSLSGPGIFLPANRSVPIVPFPQAIVCEIKRRSPSRGVFASELDPVELAGRYIAQGATAISVLTEQDHFGGGLADLMAIKRRYPGVTLLRKDFLFDEEDIRVSFRAGADAVLLIAAILEPSRLKQLLACAQDLGLAALVEVHDQAELEAVRPLQPALVGMNSRDLASFEVDLLRPLELAAQVDWPASLVFESGIFEPIDVRLAADGGFDAVLVGEAAVTDPGRIRALRSAMISRVEARRTANRSGALGRRPIVPFWSAVAVRRAAQPGSPLVKICGITNEYDALSSVAHGADMIGLVYADSVRSAPEGLAQRLSVRTEFAGGGGHAPVPIVAVVVEPTDIAAPSFWLDRVRADLAAGAIAAVQLHGAAEPETVVAFDWPCYKALRPASVEEASTIGAYPSPRVLIDAFHPHQLGGTGTEVDSQIIAAASRALNGAVARPLWLAGGLDPTNVRRLVAQHRPELVDASSRLEQRPGHKDAALVAAFIDAAKASR